MNRSLFFTLDGNSALADAMLMHGSAILTRAELELRCFPDGESYVRILSECRDQHVVILCSLFNPDQHIMPLVFLTETLRELGARSICLVSPYLAYMRQDRRFHEGEAVSSRVFAKLLSQYVDRLVTVDPHLHRYASLGEIYAIPNTVLHADNLIAQWLMQHIAQPLLVGPDSESEQWVAAVAKAIAAPYIVLEKIRHGDRHVEVSVPSVSPYKHCTPVLLDDIISSGHTLIETVKHLKKTELAAPVCIAVHGLFAEHSDEKIVAAGAARIITTNSIGHRTNAIDLSQLLLSALSSDRE